METKDAEDAGSALKAEKTEEQSDASIVKCEKYLSTEVCATAPAKAGSGEMFTENVGQTAGNKSSEKKNFKTFFQLHLL